MNPLLICLLEFTLDLKDKPRNRNSQITINLAETQEGKARD